MIYANASGVLSQSSKLGTDPLSDVLDVLGARVVRQTRMEAGGAWSFAFPRAERLKFVAVLDGAQWMLLPGEKPRCMKKGDVCLIGRTPYTVASDPDLEPQDGSALYAEPGQDVARVGSGDAVNAIGGSIAFSDPSADFLLDMLPAFMLVPRDTSASEGITAVLDMISKEIARDAIGAGIVSGRLADVLVVEALRAYAAQEDLGEMGWLGAVGDPRLGRALRAIHEDVAKPWTVTSLAAVAGMSRAAFSQKFSERVGRPPLSYVRYWRLTRARTALAKGGISVEAVAGKVGYTSQAAFGHAFKQAFGVSPKAGSTAGVAGEGHRPSVRTVGR